MCNLGVLKSRVPTSFAAPSANSKRKGKSIGFQQVSPSSLAFLDDAATAMTSASESVKTRFKNNWVCLKIVYP